jgi:hypothetical protein
MIAQAHRALNKRDRLETALSPVIYYFNTEMGRELIK